MSKIIPGYTRLSKREQAENSHALEQHIARLEAAGATHIYYDIASRSKNDRSELNKVLKLIENREVSEAIFIRVDRMTDSAMLLEKAITLCLESGARIRGLDDAIDFHTVGGRTHARILVTLARAEVERLSERVKHGWKHLRDREGAVNPPFGYIKICDRHALDTSPFLCELSTRKELSIAVIARSIVETFLDSQSLRLAMRRINERYGIQTFAYSDGQNQKGGRVARGMFRFSTGGLRTWLTNPVLQGHICYLRVQNGRWRDRADWDIRYNTHADQRLITDEEAQQIEAILAHNRAVRGYGSTALKYPMSGLVFCGECRGACYSMKGSKGRNSDKYNYYFQCKNWRDRGCSQKRVVRMEIAEEAVIEKLTARAHTLVNIASDSENIIEPPELQKLRSQLATLQTIDNPAIESAIVLLQRQIENFMRSLQQGTTDSHLARELLLAHFSSQAFWRTLPSSDKQVVYRKLVSRVVVKNGEVIDVILNV